MDNGAHYFRCDFQVHSPRDLSWTGESKADNDSREAFAKSFISACREKNLDAVAITDHHDLCFYKYIKAAADNELAHDGTPIPENEKIIVFPGIELTLNVPCQAILILDSDIPLTLLPQVLTVLAITPSPDSDEKTAPVVRLDAISTFEQLKQKLDEHDFLCNRYIILPNVTSGGSDTLLRDGVANKYKTMPCVGGYLDRSIQKCKEGDLNILNGDVAHYGNKRIAIFQTSDSRSQDHSMLGEHSTWVKWSTPTAEAIRQACLAQESRISQYEPVLPSTVIESIQVSNSEFLGPIDLEMNPQYTALIGSRGTGKSTILEYLRWTLCDDLSKESNTDSDNNFIQRRNLIANTLEKLGAVVEVRFRVNGVPHMVRRSSIDGATFLKISDGDLEECVGEDVRSLLPIQAYSQKQLSRVGVRLDELDRFVKSGIKTELDSINARSRSLISELRQIHASVRRKRNIIRNVLLGIVPMFHAMGWGLPFAASMLGCKQVMPHRFMIPDAFLKLIEEEEVTISAGVPTIWQGVRAALTANPDKYDISKLTRTTCGGSAPPVEMMRWYWDTYKIEMLQGWGMTETNPLGTLSRKVAKRSQINISEDQQFENIAKAGLAMPGLEIEIFDEEWNALPHDGEAVGELCIRGPWIASEYYNDPQPDKFHDGWLVTGDVAKIDSEQYIIISDRSKDLIKSGGEWISSVDLENHIVGLPEIAMAAVVAQPHPKWDERPLAMVVMAEGKTLDADAVLEHCSKVFAKWQLPDEVVAVEALPLGPTGKIDKKTIRANLERDGYKLPDLR